MIRSQRLSSILQIVDEKGAVTVDFLVTTLQASPATVRRDLDYLQSRGEIRRTRGGAESVEQRHASRLFSGKSQFDARKQAIAKHCTQFLQPGQVIGMTGGSTVTEVANAIVEWARQNSTTHFPSTNPLLTIVTNAIDVAYKLSNRADIKVVVVGGQLNQTSFETTGPFSIHMISQLRLDLAFIGVNGFDENGPGTVDEYEAATNQEMVERADQAIVVADSSKFGKRSFSSVGGTDKAHTVVTDSGIGAETLHDLEQRGYEVHVAKAKKN